MGFGGQVYAIQKNQFYKKWSKSFPGSTILEPEIQLKAQNLEVWCSHGGWARIQILPAFWGPHAVVLI